MEDVRSVVLIRNGCSGDFYKVTFKNGIKEEIPVEGLSTDRKEWLDAFCQE